MDSVEIVCGGFFDRVNFPWDIFTEENRTHNLRTYIYLSDLSLDYFVVSNCALLIKMGITYSHCDR